MAISSDPNAKYSMLIGLLYTFNLIVGTGALAIPKAFQDAGFVLGLLILAVLGFFSFLSSTYVVECMFSANIALAKHDVLRTDDPSNDDDFAPRNREKSKFDAFRQVEVGQMASLFLNKGGTIFFYACLILYLFGDLSIYATVVPKSIVQVVCSYIPDSELNMSCYSNFTLSPSLPCLAQSSLTRIDVYRLCVAAFGLLLGPFVFTNVTKTKYLQVLTSLTRWAAFAAMLILTAIYLSRADSHRPPRPAIANVNAFGSLFGVCVYAFMCQHSLPALLTPIRNKSHIHSFLSLVFVVVFAIYAALALTGIFTFTNLYDVYTLNFGVPTCPSATSSSELTTPRGLAYFLALFPVFTLSTNFPIIAITLRNNVRRALFASCVARKVKRPVVRSPSSISVDSGRASLRGGDDAVVRRFPRNSSATAVPGEGEDCMFSYADAARETENEIVAEDEETSLLEKEQRGSDDPLTRFEWFLITILVPLSIVVLPLIVAELTDNVEFLVAFTGSYAGVGVQYVLPALLIWGAKRKMVTEVPQEFRSPFRHVGWIVAVLGWAGFAVAVVTVNHIMSRA